MSYLVLARKYRPQTFDQVIEQDHITRTLSNAIVADRVAHAILFSGPRGTGKTTVARILAKAMNCKEGPTPAPCNVCRSCSEITSGNAVDVFEIDGASNNSVDQVRELRDNIKYMPAHSLYKIYVIDEVHMLSTPAFNALLKTLEEPPAHVMFVFATTEPHKIPVTILSRCQRYDFRRIGLDSISKHLGLICRQEGFAIGDESLGLIARQAGGSMRDALSLLDQVMSCSRGSITHEQLLEILGVIDRKYIFDLSASILRSDIAAVLETLDNIYDRGHDMKKLYAELLEHFRNLLVVKMDNKLRKLVDLPAHEIEQMIEQAQQVSAPATHQIFDLLFKEEASIRLALQPKLALEMAFIRMCQMRPALPIDDLIDKLDCLRKEITNGQATHDGSSSGTDHSNVECRSEIEPEQKKPARSFDEPPLHFKMKVDAAGRLADAADTLTETWDGLFERISQKNPSLAASLTKCSLKKVSPRRLEIEVRGNGFTVDLIRRDKNLAFLRRVCADYFGEEKQIVFKTKLDSGKENPPKKDRNHRLKQKALSHPLVAEAIEIFNGKLIDVKIP